MAFMFHNPFRAAPKPVLNSAGEDISDLFGPQKAATPWGQMNNQERFSAVGGILGGGQREESMRPADTGQDALAAFLARIGQGATAAQLPDPPPRRFGFGGR